MLFAKLTNYEIPSLNNTSRGTLGAGRQFDINYVGNGLLSTTKLTNGVLSRE